MTPSLARLRRSGILAFALVAAGACRTPPDVSSFASATSDLAASIKTSERTVSAELTTLAKAWPKEQKELAASIAASFQRQWSARDALADALLEYSASLVAIVQAGNEGEQSARALAGSFQQLCSAIDVAMPPAGAVEAAVNLGASLYAKFAQHYAATTLGEGMREMQPYADEASKLLAGSLSSIATGLDAIRDQIRQNVEDELVGDEKVSSERNRLKVLRKRRVDLLGETEAVRERTRAARADLASHPTAETEKSLAQAGSALSALESEVASVEASLQTQTAILAPYDARETDDERRLSTEIELVMTARDGLATWASAHARIATAALEKRPLQVDDLVQTAQQIRELARALQAGRKD
ncbi:MAG TPA: hypothetical protein VKE69_14435 [Planctomycetota bacterium]|nr:hypothetical protein [Planctomycetota bacterium]